MKHFLIRLAALALLAAPLHAQEDTPATSQPAIGDATEEAALSGTLTVATREAPPFAFRGPDNEWTGIAIEMWAALADELDLDYTLEEASLADMIEGTTDGRFDAAVAALTITPEREGRLDFRSPTIQQALVSRSIPARRAAGCASRQTSFRGNF